MSNSRDEAMAKYLDTFTPAEAIRSQVFQRLLSSFRSFFSRGSPRDFCELLPSLETAFHAPSASPFLHDHAVPLPTPTRTATSDAVRMNRRLSRSLDPPSQSDSSPFGKRINARVPTHQRTQSLTRVLDGITKAPQHPYTFYKDFWSAHKGHVFSSTSSTQSRIMRLFYGRKLIDREQHRFECAGRLSLVFLAHDVEVIKDQDWKLTPGQSRQHAAVISIAKHLNVKPDEIKKEWRRSRNYVKLMEVCGPGSLLELGTNVNWYWEKALTKEDVINFIEYRKEKLPHLASRVQELNHVAGEMMLDGMLAYGWTRNAIFRTNTRLRNALALHCPHLDSVLGSQSEAPYPAPTPAVLTSFSDLTTGLTPSTQDTVICEQTSMDMEYIHELLPITPTLPADLQQPLSLSVNAGDDNDSDLAMQISGNFDETTYLHEDIPMFPGQCSNEVLSIGEGMLTSSEFHHGSWWR